MLILGYARSPFRDFESYLKTFVGLDEVDIRLISKQYNSNSVTYKIPPGTYSIKDISEVVYTLRDHDGTLKIEHDCSSKKTNVILKRIGGNLER